MVETSEEMAENWEFMWGEKVMDIGSSKRYRSMRYEGVWYSIHDCVWVNPNHVGKLMRLFEDKGQRKIRIRWFLRAEEFVEVPPCMTDPKEVFIAMGGKRGVENEVLVVMRSLYLVWFMQLSINYLSLL